MILDVKVTFHTSVAVGEENQLYVWLIRMGELIIAEELSKQVAISIYTDNNVSLGELPPLPCISRICQPSGGTLYGSQLLKMAVLNEALSPACPTAVVMGLNVLPVHSLKPFMSVIQNSLHDHIALCHGRNKISELSPQGEEEHFRRQVISTHYYSSDLMVFDVDKTSRKLAAIRTFDLVERRQQIKNQGDNVVDDILNKLLPTTTNFRSNDVLFINPLLSSDKLKQGESKKREQAYKIRGAVVFDRNNLPWNNNRDGAVSRLLPYGLYTEAMYNALEWLEPEFVKAVLTQALKHSKLDNEMLFKLPLAVKEALHLDAPPAALYDLLYQLKREGSLQ
ncbi:hypothetical protein [Vibrio cincinnatiensis]|uniref:hypothetical protein n=1 Tax=Vibrio cincinnatiensis TaxID=675 RepID=UPI001EDED665|nr:hypothetical protein [Vibrio cincinnatiensis]MCG3723682.1 hypothetical protein [Vibrio cincinnatiensis]